MIRHYFFFFVFQMWTSNHFTQIQSLSFIEIGPQDCIFLLGRKILSSPNRSCHHYFITKAYWNQNANLLSLFAILWNHWEWHIHFSIFDFSIDQDIRKSVFCTARHNYRSWSTSARNRNHWWFDWKLHGGRRWSRRRVTPTLFLIRWKSWFRLGPAGNWQISPLARVCIS